MTDRYIAKKIDVSDGQVYVDGVRLPWHIGVDIEVNSLSPKGDLWDVRLSIMAEAFTCDNSIEGLEPRNTDEEATMIETAVAEMADALDRKGEKP